MIPDTIFVNVKYFDVASIQFSKSVDQVFEIFDMSALVRADGNRINIFLHRRFDNILYRAIMGEMDNFGAAGLENAAHDIDSRIMPVKQARSGKETNPVGLSGTGRWFVQWHYAQENSSARQVAVKLRQSLHFNVFWLSDHFPEEAI